MQFFHELLAMVFMEVALKYMLRVNLWENQNQKNFEK